MRTYSWRSRSESLEQPRNSVSCQTLAEAGRQAGCVPPPRQVCTVMREERDSIFIKGVIDKSSRLSLLLLLCGPPASESHIHSSGSRSRAGRLTVPRSQPFSSLGQGTAFQTQGKKPRKLLFFPLISKIRHAIETKSQNNNVQFRPAGFPNCCFLPRPPHVSPRQIRD